MNKFVDVSVNIIIGLFIVGCLVMIFMTTNQSSSNYRILENVAAKLQNGNPDKIRSVEIIWQKGGTARNHEVVCATLKKSESDRADIALLCSVFHYNFSIDQIEKGPQRPYNLSVKATLTNGETATLELWHNKMSKDRTVISRRFRSGILIPAINDILARKGEKIDQKEE